MGLRQSRELEGASLAGRVRESQGGPPTEHRRIRRDPTVKACRWRRRRSGRDMPGQSACPRAGRHHATSLNREVASARHPHDGHDGRPEQLGRRPGWRGLAHCHGVGRRHWRLGRKPQQPEHRSGRNKRPDHERGKAGQHAAIIIERFAPRGVRAVELHETPADEKRFPTARLHPDRADGRARDHRRSGRAHRPNMLDRADRRARHAARTTSTT